MNRSMVTTDHDEIRKWAEARGGKPAAVTRTKRGKNDTGMIRIDFPGYSGGKSLERISWDSWFEKFDDAKLAIILQHETKDGEQSNFNKLVARESVKNGGVDKTKSRRARARTPATAKRGHGARGTQRRAKATTKRASTSAGARKSSQTSARSGARTTRRASSGTKTTRRTSAGARSRSRSSQRSGSRAANRR